MWRVDIRLLLGYHAAMAFKGSRLSIVLPEDFRLAVTVCSYGYFLLAPNFWDKKRQRLCHVFGGLDGLDEVVKVEAWEQHGKQEGGGVLRVVCDRKLTRGQGAELKGRLSRILRLEMDLERWFKVFPEAREKKYGRLYRCGSLWEDLVKTMTSCNVTWPSTVRMNELLCERVGGGAFPSPEQVLKFSVDRLQARCRLGYRAKRVHLLAQSIVDGEFDLAWLEEDGRTGDEVYKKVKGIYGMGEFSAHNVLQLLGYFEHVPIDTETYRHFRQVHGYRIPEKGQALKRVEKRILRHYKGFQPYAFLAYWYELQQGYEDKTGNPEDWPALSSSSFTAKNL